MKKEKGRISVFKYRDYRRFLAEWFAEAKTRNPAFSYRSFAMRAGFGSSNFFMLVMQGKRNLTEDSLQKVVTGVRLNKQEQEFFRNLVFFNQAKTHSDKDLYYKKLLQSKKYQTLMPIERQKYEYYSKWYHPVVRELIISKGFDGTPDWIAQNINPPITPDHAKKSIELLEALGFIKRTGHNKWKQTSAIVSTGPEVKSVIVHNYHKTLLDLSKHMMDKLTVTHRDVSALTVGVKKEKVAQIRAKIIEFRREILKLVSEETEPEVVAQLNIQFFPVNRTENRGEEK